MKYHSLILVLLVLSFGQCHAQHKGIVDAKIALDNIHKVENYLLNLEKSGFSGTVLLDVGGTKQFSNGYGYSNREDQIKNNKHTIFDIGSISKQFTAAGILKLEMLGKLSVSDKLSIYLEDIPADKANITLHHLLTHSSGLPSGIGDDYDQITKRDFITKSLQQNLMFEIGTAYEYSNLGYSLLGIVIEQVSGKTYESFLYEHLWKPAGMEETGYTRPSFIEDQIAVGYQARGANWGKPNNQHWDIDAPYWHLKANGGILSTVDDLYKWHKSLLTENVLSQEAKSKYYSPHIKEGEMESYYGYGWAIHNTSRNTKLVAHNGGNDIFFADFWRYLEDDITIIVMTNSATSYSSMIASQIAAITILEDYEPKLPSSEPNESELGREDVDDFAQMAMKVLSNKNENSWKSFIVNHGAPGFIKMVPMNVHLEYFGQFYNRLNGALSGEIELLHDELIIEFKNDDGSFSLILNIEKSNDGSIKLAGMMVD